MTRPRGYSISDYGRMISCKPRMSAFAEALRQAVTPGCTVIDLGAGTGIFALLACQYGAAKVIAIEPDDGIELLPALAVANGFGDRITAFKGLSSDFTPAEKVDVVISDLHGSLPLFEAHIPTVIDARERLLKPGGILIPARDHLMIALASSADQRDLADDPWRENGLDLDLSLARRFVTNDWHKVRLGADALASRPVKLGTLDYATIESPSFDGSASLVATKDTMLDGLVLWFDAEVADGLGYTNAPGEPPLVYGQTFLPLEETVTVAPGDRVSVQFTARLIDGQYIFAWNTKVLSTDGETKREFRQSTFSSRITNLAAVEQASEKAVPIRSVDVDIELACLALFDGERSLMEIAGVLAGQFPDQFAGERQALNRVAAIHGRFLNRRGRIISG